MNIQKSVRNWLDRMAGHGEPAQTQRWRCTDMGHVRPYHHNRKSKVSW